MRVHFSFGDTTPDLLTDLLVSGFAAHATVTMWPDKPWIYGPAPVLHHPMLQVWGGPGCASAHETRDWLAVAQPDDLLICTHRSTAFPKAPCRRLALDTYDLPMFGWRDAAKASGYPVVAREQPRAGEVPVDYPFNPLWVPSLPGTFQDRSILSMLAGDLDVGKRRKYAEVLQTNWGSVAKGSMWYGDWQETLARTRICVVPHGAGEKTYRLWEAGAAGCCLLVERFLPGNEVQGLVEGDTCVFFDGPEDFQERLSTISWFTAMRLGSNIREVAWATHTPEVVARRLIEAAV